MPTSSQWNMTAKQKNPCIKRKGVHKTISYIAIRETFSSTIRNKVGRSTSHNNMSKTEETPLPPPKENYKIHNRPSLGMLNPLFHKREQAEDDNVVTKSMMKKARTVGVFALTDKGLTTVPEKVYSINESDGDSNVNMKNLTATNEDSWWNQVPLNTLDLSFNSLAEISSKIANLDSLQYLTLHNNLLKTLPKEIGKLENLVRVNLSRNNITELPVEFFTLPKLLCLNLSHNKLNEIHPAITDLHMLEVLDLSNNSLTSLPCGIGFLTRLRELHVAHNALKDVPADLVNMRCMQLLELEHNELRSLPEDIGCLHKLQFCYVQNNFLNDLPEFDGCSELQELYASNNRIHKLGKTFCEKLPHLKVLDLRNNKIEIIPNEIDQLQNLVRLDLTNNSVKRLPNSLSHLAHLTSLQVEGNLIKSVRRDVLQRGSLAILKLLREREQAEYKSDILRSPRRDQFARPENCDKQCQPQSADMGGDGLNSPRLPRTTCTNDDSIFPDKYKMRKSRCLTVTMQNITDVPDSVFQEASEESVYLVDFSKNRLTTLPDGLHHLAHSTTELVFSNNLLNSIPIFISQFTRISVINFSGNNLTDFPKEFSLLNTLRELDISNNRFEQIPDCIYELQSLEILLARNNRIKFINASGTGLAALKCLATLDLRNNNIEMVPPVLGTLKNINTLDLVGNPFRQPRHQVLEKGTEAVMSYLRDRMPV